MMRYGQHVPAAGLALSAAPKIHKGLLLEFAALLHGDLIEAVLPSIQTALLPQAAQPIDAVGWGAQQGQHSLCRGQGESKLRPQGWHGGKDTLCGQECSWLQCAAGTTPYLLGT